MQKRSFEEALELILKDDHRYSIDAYLFVRECLDFTIKMLHKPDAGPARHVSGRELLEGIRLFALQEFGPMARTVLGTWGIARTGDFGEIVFNLVNKGVLGKTAEDKKDDFAGGYDFHAAFVKPFMPAQVERKSQPPASRRAATERHPIPHQDNS